MIKLSDFRALLRGYCLAAKATSSAIRYGYTDSEEQLTELVDYVLASECAYQQASPTYLALPAVHILEYVSRFFRDRPDCDGEATARLVRVIDPANPKPRTRKDTRPQYLAVDIA